jgi:hypothetical protein
MELDSISGGEMHPIEGHEGFNPLDLVQTVQTE